MNVISSVLFGNPCNCKKSVNAPLPLGRHQRSAGSAQFEQATDAGARAWAGYWPGLA